MSVNVNDRPLTPAVVVVDARNVWGSARAMFGQGRQVRVQGVCEALAAFGFDVVEVYVAIGTEGPDRHPPRSVILLPAKTIIRFTPSKLILRALNRRDTPSDY